MKINYITITALVFIPLLACKQHASADGTENQSSAALETILFEDSMLQDWRKNWFLDGKRAVLKHEKDGLSFEATPSGVNKNEDRETFDSHHAVLWTKMTFEGDIRITYEIEKSSGTNLLYIQAQGIGMAPYEEDIHAWRDLRNVASMDQYFNHMSLLSISFRENIRCKRYPWNDVERGIQFNDVLFKPMLEYDRMRIGGPYRVVVEKRKASLMLRIQEIGNPENALEHVWDTSLNPPAQRPRFIEKGRIGLRHMGGTHAIYRNLKVEKL
jgi:hypothetical protein